MWSGQKKEWKWVKEANSRSRIMQSWVVDVQINQVTNCYFHASNKWPDLLCQTMSRQHEIGYVGWVIELSFQ